MSIKYFQGTNTVGGHPLPLIQLGTTTRPALYDDIEYRVQPQFEEHQNGWQLIVEPYSAEVKKAFIKLIYKVIRN